MLDKLKATEERYIQIEEQLALPDVFSNNEKYTSLMKEYKTLTPIIEKFREYNQAKSENEDALAMLEENLDAEMRELVSAELKETKARMEALTEELTPMLWKMTRYEGKILLKLIDRETNHTVFKIIKEFRSGVTATFYQVLAQMFGNNLKLEYDPTGEDEMLEYIVKQYRAGVL